MPLQSSQLAHVDQGAAANCPSARFVHWATAQLELELVQTDDGACELIRFEETEPDGQLSRKSVFQWSASPGTALDVAVIDEGLLGWLAGELRAAGPAVHARPKCQPSAIHDFSSRLFGAYDVDGGSVHLGGCHLEDRPFLRLTYVSENGEGVEHFYFGRDGVPIDPSIVVELGLDEIVPTGPYPPRIDAQQLSLLVSAGRRYIDGGGMALGHATRSDNGSDNGSDSGNEIGFKNGSAAASETPPREPIATVILWAKYVVGKLEFTIGDATADLPFDGWAKTLSAPIYPCRESQTESFHLGVTDDGRIVAADAIAACSKSGKRVVRSELVECHVSGQPVLAEFTKACPISGQPALREEFAPCTICQQDVSRAVLEDDVCQACRDVAPVSKDDPRIVWLLGEYPGLDRFRKWRLSETASVYIVHAVTLWKRFLLVIDQQSIEVLRSARRSALQSEWTDLEPAERDDLLG